MNIADYIPYGEENAISRDFLASLYGGGETGDRKARKALQELREHQVILNLQDGSGYFRPTAEDYDLVVRQMNASHSRAFSILRQVRAYRDWLEEHSGQVALEE